MAHRGPASTASNQHYLLESARFGKVNPSGEVSHFFTGYSPIATAANPFTSSVSSDISQVVHASIGRDAGIAAFRKSASNLHVGRIVKIHPPAVNPDVGIKRRTLPFNLRLSVYLTRNVTTPSPPRFGRGNSPAVSTG